MIRFLVNFWLQLFNSFLKGLDDNDRLLAVSHPYLLKCLRQVTRAGIDATFKSAPGNYYQVCQKSWYTIYQIFTFLNIIISRCLSSMVS